GGYARNSWLAGILTRVCCREGPFARASGPRARNEMFQKARGIIGFRPARVSDTTAAAHVRARSMPAHGPPEKRALVGQWRQHRMPKLAESPPAQLRVER